MTLNQIDCFSTYTRSDLNICRRKSFKADLNDISKVEFTQYISFCLDQEQVNNAQLLRDSEPIRFLETPRSPSEYILIAVNGRNDYGKHFIVKG